MKQYNVIIAALLGVLMGCLSVSCSKEEKETFTPVYLKYDSTNLFEIPYMVFGTSKEHVMSVITQREIISETSDKIVYSGQKDDLFQVYYFTDNKLMECATFFQMSHPMSLYISGMSRAYTSLGEVSGPVSAQYGYINYGSYVLMTKQQESVLMVDYVDQSQVSISKYDVPNGQINVYDLDHKVIRASEYLPW